MNRFLIILLVLAIPFAFADWKSLDQNARSESPLAVNLLSSTDQEVQVEVTIPGYQEKVVKVGDTECLFLHIPGGSMYMEKGFPLLPKVTQLVQIPHDCKIKLEVLSKEEVEVDLKVPIVPSRGHLNRDIDPATVPFEFGPVYKEDVYWPAEEDQFQVGKNFELRDLCGLRLQVLPIRVNHVQMKMKVIKKVVIALKVEHEMARSYRQASQPNKTFNRLYSEMFLNYEEPMVRGTVPDQNNRKLVVVTPQSYESALSSWVEWKKKSGYAVTVHTVSSGVNANDIKTYLQGLYDNAATRFGYLVLIGDAAYNSDFTTCQPMPTFKGSKESAAADRVYVRLAGNDNYPDAFVSRISGNNASEIKNQLDKIVAYESNPTGGEWFVQGMCIASNQGSPADKERAEGLQNGGGKTEKVPIVDGGLIGYGYQKFSDVYDPYAYAEDVAAATNAGCSIICYIGHGSSTSWGTTGFSVSDVHKLTNAGKYPVIWSVACVNGQFVHTTECFAEAWLRQANGGSVAMEAASTNESWVPPCDKQAATVNALINKTHFTFGALETVGCVKALEVWGDANSTEGNKLAEQCNLFGDCTLMVRSKKPQAIDVTASRALDTVNFAVVGQEREVKHLIVTVYSQDSSYTTSEETETGRVDISLQGCPEGDLFYTVVGDDIVPVVDRQLK